MWEMENSDQSSSKLRSIYLYIPLVFSLFSLLTACVTLKDPEGSQLHQTAVIGKVDAQSSFGQSFVSRRGQFNGIDLWLSIDPESQERTGTLFIELYHNPEQANPLAVVPLSFSDIAQSRPVTISFPPQAGSPGQDYYLSMNTSGGSVQVFGRAEDAYPYGTANLNGKPIAADAAFRLSYDYGLQGMITDLQKFLFDVWLIFPLGLALIVPGWLLLNLSGVGKGFDLGAQIAISVGISLAIVPILMTWTSLLGITWSSVSVLFTAGLVSAFALWRFWSTKAWRVLKIDWYGFALLGIFILSLAVRLAMVRDLFAPAWVDSVHHGVITRLITETGGFPDNYSPYLSIDSANYHPGFHSVLATFLWLSGLELQTGMLALGQVLNALTIFGTYLFTVTITRDRTAGVFAALITGLITPMPAYYSSWGRYTQLAGLLILPVAFVIIKQGYALLNNSSSNYGDLYTPRHFFGLIASKWTLLLLAGITIGGLFLTHYRVAAFLICLIFADFISQIWPKLKKGATWRDLLWEIVLILVAGVIAILLIAPWLPPTFTTLLIPKFQAWRGGNVRLFDGFAWVFLNSALGQYALVLSALGLIWGIIKRRWFTLTLVLWVVMLFILANLAHWGLPGSVLINNLSVEITLFIPISVLGGYLFSELFKKGRRVIPLSWHKWYYLGVGFTSIVIGLIGARQLLPILNPITFLFREADRPALNWLEENIPEGETVLINPFAWGYGLYAGQDGGYWASTLAGHRTIPPPVLYGLSNTPEDIQQINKLSQQVIENGDNAETLHELMIEAGIQYVFTGARGGAISPRALLDSQLFELLYDKDGTWTFRVNQNP